MYRGLPSFRQGSWHGWAHFGQSRMIVAPFLGKEHQLEAPRLSPNPTVLLASLMTFGNSLPHLSALVSSITVPSSLDCYEDSARCSK